MKKLKKTTVPILNDTYYVYLLYGDKNKAEKWVSDYYPFTLDKYPFENNKGATFHGDGYHPTIWISEDAPEPYSTVAHEAVHAIKWIWNDIGEYNHDEVFAHSVGTIVRYFIKLLEK